jgi:hypothetical protein
VLEYGKGAYLRTRGNLPPLETVNMFVEESKTQGVIMQSRRPLDNFFAVGPGPVRASLARDGVFGGDRFTVSGSGFYRGATLLGLITGTGVAWIAARDGEVLVCAGGSLYSYNGTDFVAVSFPDNSNVTKVLYTNGYFIALEAGTGFWFFSASDNGRSWDALDFANVESEPDAILDAVILDGVIVFAGRNSVEFWAPTGNAELPFSPIQQRIFEQGIRATGCIVQDDNTFFWVGADNILYRNGDVPQALGGDFLVERIEASVTCRVYLLKDGRHKWVCIRLDSETWAYDITTGDIFEPKSYGRDNFRCGPDYGDDTIGMVWQWGDYGSAAEGIVERVVTAGMLLDDPITIDRLRITSEIGTTPYLTGDYIAPQVELRLSDDAGNTWSPWEAESLGEQGDYRTVTEWRALGMFDSFGVLAQFRVTDPVSWRFSRLALNGQGGGRA